MAGRGVVALQSHLDMVHQKNADTTFDFATQGIEMYVDGDWVKARGTTLGADNGLGVAAIMALLSSEDISHPPLEALFTIDEETGMTGAEGLKGGLLSAQVLLNLDTEEDDELTIGCAGGIDVTATGNYSLETLAHGHQVFEVKIHGLSGGHSGADIHLGRGNANKLMNRFLLQCLQAFELEVVSIDGGGLRNAIPRESTAIVACNPADEPNLLGAITSFNEILAVEYAVTDPNVEIQMAPSEAQGEVVHSEKLKSILQAIYACPNGIYRMSPDIEGLVQTSNNIARVVLQEGNYQVLCLTRSSSDSEKADEVASISSAFELIGAQVSTSGSYPGWTPKPEAPIVKIMSKLYKEINHTEAHVSAIHAGLECGILGRNYPDMDMISFGPTIRGAHSPDERAQISSVQKFWGYLLETLKNIP